MNQATAAIGLGSNLGDSFATLQAAVQQLAATPGLRVSGQSHWYQTSPIGPPQPDYLNGCLVLQTHYPPEQILKILLATEKQFGRVRKERWGPRTLDLDLLLYDQVVLETSVLTIPHPHLHERAFVLVPLAELLPNWIHPTLSNGSSADPPLTIAQLVQTVDCTGVTRLPPS